MTLKEIRDKIKAMFGSVIVGGTIMASSENERYPTFIANEGMGGLHTHDTLIQLANEPIGRLQIGMKATVNQHDSNGVIIKRTSYVLESLPNPADYPSIVNLDRISDIPGYNLSDYWKVDKPIADFEGAMQTQYAPNCDQLTGVALDSGSTPPFPNSGKGRKVTKEEYASLVVGTTVTPASVGPAIEGYWSDEFDFNQGHAWMRIRSGINSDWSNPFKVSGEGYEAGDYIENRFKWSETKPDTPPQYYQGKLNNEPVGWSDTPIEGTGRLWMIKAQKDVYQQLKGPWLPPIEIKSDPLLTRYNERAVPSPNDVAYADLDSNGWETVFISDKHKYIATRELLGDGSYTPWLVRRMTQESGEYTDYVFKPFMVSQIDTILDNPDSYRPQGSIPQGWADTPGNVADGYILFVSSAKKFFNGELMDIWSDPIPFSGQDSIIDLIKSSGGDEFKKDKVGVVTPSNISLTAYLWKGINEIIPEAIVWTRIYNNGAIDTTAMGTTSSITISPTDVDGQSIFQCKQTYQEVDYISEYSIVDIADGIDAKSLVLTANTQIVTKKTDGSRLPASGVLLRAFHSNLNDADGLTWYKRNNIEDPWVVIDGITGDSYAVPYTLFDTDNEIHFKVEADDTYVDGVTKMFDEFTLYEVPEASGGAPATVMILSNESHTVVKSEETGTVNYAGASTSVKIFEGSNDVTSLWTVSKSDQSTIVSSLNNTNTSKPVITVTGITSSSSFVTITATKNGSNPVVSISKQFSVNMVSDPIGAILLDIDPDSSGYSFSPGNTNAKTLTANLYVNGTLRTADVTYQWYIGSDDVVDGTARTFLVEHTAVSYSANVKCVATLNGKTYTRVVTITDVKDSKGIGILYSNQDIELTSSHKPAGSVVYNATSATTTFNSITVNWTNNATAAVWMSTKKQGDLNWSNPIRIKGEKGEQGTTGNYIKNIFKRSEFVPSTPTGNPIPTGWSDIPPATGTGKLWVSYGEIDTDEKLVGSWSAPVQLEGKDGINGPAGPMGPTGPEGPMGPQGPKGSYSPAVMTVFPDTTVRTMGAVASEVLRIGKLPREAGSTVPGMLIAIVDVRADTKTDWVSLYLEIYTWNTAIGAYSWSRVAESRLFVAPTYWTQLSIIHSASSFTHSHEWRLVAENTDSNPSNNHYRNPRFTFIPLG
jgi:hypothetical protein